MFEKAYEFDNDVICALEWILFMILGNGHATSSTSTRRPSSGKFSENSGRLRNKLSEFFSKF